MVTQSSSSLCAVNSFVTLSSRRLALLTVALLLTAGCSNSDSSSGTASPAASQSGTAASKLTAPVKVQLRLNWFPEAEHGGYYAALVHGFFEQQGLDVEILKGGPGVPVRE